MTTADTLISSTTQKQQEEGKKDKVSHARRLEEIKNRAMM